GSEKLGATRQVRRRPRRSLRPWPLRAPGGSLYPLPRARARTGRGMHLQHVHSVLGGVARTRLPRTSVRLGCAPLAEYVIVLASAQALLLVSRFVAGERCVEGGLGGSPSRIGDLKDHLEGDSVGVTRCPLIWAYRDIREREDIGGIA